MVFKQGLRTHLSLLRPDVGNTVLRKQAKQIQDHDKRGAKMHKFSLGDNVRVRSHRGERESWLPGEVVKVIGPQTYLVHVAGKTRYVHMDHLRSSGETSSAWESASSLPIPQDWHPPDRPVLAPQPVEAQREIPPQMSKEDQASVKVIPDSVCVPVEPVPVPEPPEGTAPVERRYPQRLRQAPKRLVETM